MRGWIRLRWVYSGSSLFKSWIGWWVDDFDWFIKSASQVLLGEG